MAQDRDASFARRRRAGGLFGPVQAEREWTGRRRDRSWQRTRRQSITVGEDVGLRSVEDTEVRQLPLERADPSR
jgi:hypothetical protein